MEPPEIICTGAAHWDVIARGDRPLPRGADVPGAISRRIGGVAANVALGLARLGRRARLVSAVGDDPEGAALRAALEAAGVDCAHLLTLPNRATAAYVAVEDDAGELVAAVADCAALEAPELAGLLAAPEAWLTPGALLFFEANLPDAALAALPLARAARTAANGVSPAKAPRLRGLGPVGQLYLSLAEAEALTGEAHADAAEAAGAVRALFGADALVTDGPRPAASAAAAGVAVAAPPAVRVRSVTGAGDALIAAHLDALLRGAAPEAALRAGLAAAAVHIRQEAP